MYFLFRHIAYVSFVKSIVNRILTLDCHYHSIQYLVWHLLVVHLHCLLLQEVHLKHSKNVGF